MELNTTEDCRVWLTAGEGRLQNASKTGWRGLTVRYIFIFQGSGNQSAGVWPHIASKAGCVREHTPDDCHGADAHFEAWSSTKAPQSDVRMKGAKGLTNLIELLPGNGLVGFQVSLRPQQVLLQVVGSQ